MNHQPKDDWPLALYSSLLGGITTFIGTYQQFGFAGACMLVAVLFFLVGVLFWARATNSTQWLFDFAKQFGSRPVHFFVFATFLFVFALGGYYADVFTLRLTRSHLPLVLNSLRVADADFLHKRFPTTRPSNLERGQADKEREFDSISLMKWGAYFSEMKPGHRVYYIESEPIPTNCDDVDVSCVLREPMVAKEVAAYLVAPTERGSLWRRPVMRKQQHSINNNQSAVTVKLEQPNEDERLVIFIYAATSETTVDFENPLAAAEPKSLLYYDYFEFE